MRNDYETGVLRGSESFSAAPSPLAKELFFHVVRYGHYHCDSRYRGSEPARGDKKRDYVLLYVKSGYLHVEIGGEALCADPGQAALLDLSAAQRYRAAGPLEYYWIVFNGPLASRFFSRITAAHGGRQVFYPNSGEAMEADFCQLACCLRAAGAPDEVEISQVVQRLLCRLLGLGGQLERALPAGDQPVQEAVRYIDEHFAQDLSVADVAAAVSLSYSHLSRRFKADTGCSIHEYVTHCRLREAQKLLLDTDMPLKWIASTVGYRSEASFIVAFQTKRGCTPTEYRNQIGAQPSRPAVPAEGRAIL